MDAISSGILLKAMDGLSLRATATSQNIANANSLGYRPIRVSFEDALRVASRVDAETIRAVIPRIEPATDQIGRSELRLDLEMATAASTAGRFGTLAELLNRCLQIEALSVSGTR